MSLQVPGGRYSSFPNNCPIKENLLATLSIRFICVLVTDPPEISVEREVVYSGEGHEAQLVCIVHGENQPEVRNPI